MSCICNGTFLFMATHYYLLLIIQTVRYKCYSKTLLLQLVLPQINN
jgi:hypothetical protein